MHKGGNMEELTEGQADNIKGRTGRQRAIYAAALILVFAGLFIFFAAVHPLIIYDTDDWIYISHTRQAVPLWEEWNPTRILPETLMPFCADLGVDIILPFTGDYIGSLALSFAVVLCGFIIAYFYFFVKLLRSKLQLGLHKELSVLFVLALFHFLIYNSQPTGNIHMFSEANVTCIFFYTVPALVNSALVLYFCSHEDSRILGGGNYLSKGILILAIYLSINSNMFQSIILIAFTGTKMLENLAYHIKNKDKGVKELFKVNIIWILVLACWFVSLYYEANGGRAGGYGANSFINNIPVCLKSLKNLVLFRMNRTFVKASAVFAVTAFIIYIVQKEKSKVDKAYIRMALYGFSCFLITVLYTVLLCAKTSAEYMDRSGVIFCMSFYLLMVIMASFAYILAKCPKTMMLVPLFIYIIFNETVSDSKSFKYINAPEYRENICLEIDNDIIGQIKEAESKGLDKMTLYVPEYDSDDNWPIAVYGGDYIINALRKHGMADRYISIKIKPDREMNQKYRLPKQDKN